MRTYGKVLDWRDSIKEGDVLYEGGDPRRPRRVRKVSRRHNGLFLGCVTFTKLNESWTRRCYTVIGRPDLKTRGFTPAHVTIKTKDAFDLEFERNIAYENRFPWKQTMTFPDVAGVR